MSCEEDYASSIGAMTIADVAAHLSAVSGLEPFADAIISCGINCDGELLATLVDKASIKASPFRQVGRKFNRSLLAREVRELHKKGLPSTTPAACALSGEDAATGTFALLHAGDIEAPRWETTVGAECSDNGATGVIFVNTAAGSFVGGASAGAACSELALFDRSASSTLSFFNSSLMPFLPIQGLPRCRSPCEVVVQLRPSRCSHRRSVKRRARRYEFPDID